MPLFQKTLENQGFSVFFACKLKNAVPCMYETTVNFYQKVYHTWTATTRTILWNFEIYLNKGEIINGTTIHSVRR